MCSFAPAPAAQWEFGLQFVSLTALTLPRSPPPNQKLGLKFLNFNFLTFQIFDCSHSPTQPTPTAVCELQFLDCSHSPLPIRSWVYSCSVSWLFRFLTAVTHPSPPRDRSWSWTAVELTFKFWTAVRTPHPHPARYPTLTLSNFKYICRW